MRLLLIGPLPPPIGGARVLFSQFVQALQALPEHQVEIVKTWSPREPWWVKVRAAFKCWLDILRKSRKVDLISFWASYNGSLFFSPLIWLAAFWTGKPWQVRRFGSGMRKNWKEMGALEKLLTRFLFSRADQVLLETKTAVGEMKRIFPDTEIEWHGNFRPISATPKSVRNTCSRFIFLGKVISDKGIWEIIQAAERYPAGNIGVDIYGPLTEDFSESDFGDYRNVRYRGIASPESIPELLSRYDALLLPTRFIREGYPGVILEAYMAGIPVIVSNWPSLNEIVDGKSGILIKPGDPEELYQAIRSLVTDPEGYQKLAGGAYQKRELYSLQTGVERFLELCRMAIRIHQ